MRRVRTALLVHSALGVESCALERSSLRAMKVDSVGQLIMTGVPGKELDAETARLFRRVQPGAFILFGRNLESGTQLRKLIDDLRDLSEIEPIITIDQEGGRVSRLRRIGNEPPNAQQLRDKNDIDLIRRHGDITGRLLRLFGFNLDLCPVLDISFNDDAENSLHGRCYGKDVEQVVRNAGAFNEAMRGQGIASCGKHFPGYSAATSDAHFQLPRIDRSREELDLNELAAETVGGFPTDLAAETTGIASSLDRTELGEKFEEDGLEEVPVFGATGEEGAEPEIVGVGFVNVDDGEVALAGGGDVEAQTEVDGGWFMVDSFRIAWRGLRIEGETLEDGEEGATGVGVSSAAMASRSAWSELEPQPARAAATRESPRRCRIGRFIDIR